MKKRTVTKLLSCALAISMVATAAPVTAWASEVPVAAEEEAEIPGEDTVGEETEGQDNAGEVKEDAQAAPETLEAPEAEDAGAAAEAQQEQATAPEAEQAVGRSVPIDGKLDAWAQDPQTVIGEDSVIEMYNGYLHLVAGTGNGNDVSDPAGYPAMFVNPNTFDFTKAGFFEYEIFQGSTNDDTRFGVYVDYKDPGHGLFLGYDASSGWYWQKYGVQDNPYGSMGLGGPGQSAWTKVKIEWTADGKFSMSVGGNKILSDLDSGMEHGAEGKIGFKCAGWNGNVTDVYFNNIYYEGQEGVEGYHITGKVVDDKGNPLSGVKLATGRQSAETAADGTYDLEVLDGNHTVTVTKEGYVSESVSISVDGGNVTADDIVLYGATQFDTMELNTGDMKVQVAKEFPSIVKYEMKKGSLAGKTFYGQVNRLMNIKINGESIKLKKEDVKATFTDTTATYEMTLKGNNIDCVMTAVITAKDNTASFDITKVENNLKDLDENGYLLHPVQTIEIPNHSLISVNSKQQNAHLKGAKMSSNTRISGDRDFDVTQGMRLTNSAMSEDFIYGFISNNEMSAGLWSNSEYQGSHVASYISLGGASNTRVLATVTDTADASTLGLASTQWYYDRKVTTDVVIDRDANDHSTREQRTYVVEHEIMPSAKVVIAGDANEDGDIDWQDGAVAFRSIMHNPAKCEEVPELVNYRIAMNFGSQAANPFLMNLDGVKRVYLNTEGLGQGVLLKGYGSEGHDSGHPDYGDIGWRIGGSEDMNTLLVEGKKMGALFGVHVNASEMYTEAKAFTNELSQGNFGWNWLDQGIGINSRYDLATGARQARFKELHDQVGNNLDFIYVDVWGNATSGEENEDAWATRMLFREISGLGWRVATEWGPTGEYDSTLQHWAADLEYGGYTSKGENSEVMRFLRNHQKDSWIADYPRYDGAAQAPLLGGLNMTDFEGWQGRTNYRNYINVMFRHNLITKYLQHYQVMDWKNGTPVQLSSGDTWTPEMEIKLKNTKDASDDTEIVVRRKSNDYSNLSEYRSRIITLNGVKISEGAPTGGDGSNAGNETYLIPWNWDSNGNELAADDQKMYHWNTNGGTTTWELTKDWQGLSTVVVYKLTDGGRTDKKVVNVVNNTITLEDVEAEIPYVVFKGEKAPLTVDWQTSKYVYDMGFNDQDVESHRTVVSNGGTADIVENASANHMLKLEGDVSVSTQLTNLKKGQKYALYVGVDNRSDSHAHATVTGLKDKVLGSNYAERSYAYNWVKSDQHNAYAHTENSDDFSYFQNMYVFFTADSSTATLTFKRDAGAGATYFDDIRVVETKMDVALETDENGIITSLYNDFEENAQGIWPFVISGAEGVEDNRIHLSERHEPYSQAGYISKNVDDVLDGKWSVKVNGLSQRGSIVYQTIPQNFHFQPGEVYQVSFDYQMGSNGVYEVRLGDRDQANVQSWTLAGNPGETKRYSFTFRASDSGQSWIGIYSTNKAPETGGYAGQMLDFSGYKDFVLDNLKIEKGVIGIDQTYVERDTAEGSISLNVEFMDRWVSPGTTVRWTSSDENVARVDRNGTVYFVGFGTSVITATVTAGGNDYKAHCVVHLNDSYEKTAAAEQVWANTDQGGGEGKDNVVDGDPNTLWHSNYSYGFDLSESNPAIITVKFQEDLSEFETLAFQQRSGSGNGIVEKYEAIVGDAFDADSHTITGTDGTDKFTTGPTNTKETGNGKIQELELPEGTKGHYMQIRVLQGRNGFAALGEILATTWISYDTPEERAFMAANAELFAAGDLEAAKNLLKAAIKNAQPVYDGGEGLYSNATWTAFADAFKDAQKADKTGTLEEIKEAKTALEAAQDNLKLLSESGKELDNARKALKAAIEEVKPTYEAGRGDYSAQSWEAFEDVYTEAKVALESESISKINRLATALIAAKDDLKVEAPDTSVDAAQNALKATIEAAKKVIDAGKKNYSTETWDAFEAAYDAAQAGVTSTNIAKLNRLQAALEAAQSNLKEDDELTDIEKKLEAAKKELKAAIDAVASVYNKGQKDYTDASWETFESNYVRAVSAHKSSSSISKMNRLAAALTKSKKALEKNPKVGDAFDSKNIRYKVTSVSKKTVTVVRGTDKKATSVAVASTVKFRGITFKVTAIEKKAFNGFANLKKVTIGSNVQTIKSQAFAGCKKLTQVSIGKKVNAIDSKAFYNCKNLTKTVFLGTGVKKVGSQAFKGTNAKMKVTLPAGTTSKKRNSIKLLLRKAGMSAKATVK